MNKYEVNNLEHHLPQCPPTCSGRQNWWKSARRWRPRLTCFVLAPPAVYSEPLASVLRSQWNSSDPGSWAWCFFIFSPVTFSAFLPCHTYPPGVWIFSPVELIFPPIWWCSHRWICHCWSSSLFHTFAIVVEFGPVQTSAAALRRWWCHLMNHYSVTDTSLSTLPIITCHCDHLTLIL